MDKQLQHKQAALDRKRDEQKPNGVDSSEPPVNGDARAREKEKDAAKRRASEASDAAAERDAKRVKAGEGKDVEMK